MNAAHAETDGRENDARLVAQVRNATIAECQRWLREAAELAERVARIYPIAGAGMSYAASHYRSAANLLEALRT